MGLYTGVISVPSCHMPPGSAKQQHRSGKQLWASMGPPSARDSWLAWPRPWSPEATVRCLLSQASLPVANGECSHHAEGSACGLRAGQAVLGMASKDLIPNWAMNKLEAAGGEGQGPLKLPLPHWCVNSRHQRVPVVIRHLGAHPLSGSFISWKAAQWDSQRAGQPDSVPASWGSLPS